jgi:uncharacterized protein (TIRG00374 family)
MRRTLLRAVLVIAGLVVLAAIFWKVGWPAILANLETIGPWFLALVALNLAAQVAFVVGLTQVLYPRPRWSELPRLYGIYLAGDSANYVAPASGEAVKANLLRERMEGGAALAAVTLHKQADLVAQTMLAVLGVGLAVVRFDLPRGIAWLAAAGALALVGLLVLMTWALNRGAYSPILKRLAGWKALAVHLHRFRGGAQAADDLIRAFHAAHRGRFLTACACALAGWSVGIVETYLVIRLLAPSTGWETAVAVECLAMVLNNMLLFLPGKVGGAEGVRTGVFVLVGLTAAQGAAYSLVRRTRELLWVLPGWVILMKKHLWRVREVRREPS